MFTITANYITVWHSLVLRLTQGNSLSGSLDHHIQHDRLIKVLMDSRNLLRSYWKGSTARGVRQPQFASGSLEGRSYQPLGNTLLIADVLSQQSLGNWEESCGILIQQTNENTVVISFPNYLGHQSKEKHIIDVNMIISRGLFECGS